MDSGIVSIIRRILACVVVMVDQADETVAIVDLQLS